MTKKILHITILVILMVSTMGFTITRHYCGEDLVNLSVTGQVKTCCDMQGDDCCHDEAQTYQLNQDYTSPIVINHVNYVPFIVFEIPVFLIEPLEKITDVIAFNFGESPPTKDVLHFLSDIQVYRL